MHCCQQCGDTEYDCLDGLYYCSTCQTQSQDLRVEEDGFTTSLTPSLAVRQRQRKTHSKVEDKGRAWSTYEAFTLIIKSQVESLIQLGASPQLKDIVLRLWALYLSKTNAAFIHPDSTKTPCSHRRRDLCVPSLRNPDISTRFYPRHKRHNSKHLQLDTDVSDSDEDEAGTHNDEGVTSEGETADTPTPTDYQYKTVRLMRMSHTIALCYLGLLFSNPLTSASDIVRWLQQNNIPFSSVTNDLPANMKFTDRDQAVFCSQAIPRAKTLRQWAGQLARFLELEPFPPLSLAPLVHAYIARLSLPDELHGYVKQVLDIVHQPVTYCPQEVVVVPHCELTALAYIIVTLRLIFGLNDQTEIALSDGSRRLEKLINTAEANNALQKNRGINHDGKHERGPRLFVWSDWLEEVERVVARDRVVSIKTVTDASEVARDLDSYMPHYWRHLCRHNKRHSHRKFKFHRWLKDEKLAGIVHPFTLLSERWERRKRADASRDIQDTTRDSSSGREAAITQDSPHRGGRETPTPSNVKDAGAMSDTGRGIRSEVFIRQATVSSESGELNDSGLDDPGMDLAGREHSPFTRPSTRSVPAETQPLSSQKTDQNVQFSFAPSTPHTQMTDQNVQFSFAPSTPHTQMTDQNVQFPHVPSTSQKLHDSPDVSARQEFRGIERFRNTTLRHVSRDSRYVCNITRLDLSDRVQLIEHREQSLDAGRKAYSDNRTARTRFSGQTPDISKLFAEVEDLVSMYSKYTDSLDDTLTLDLHSVSYMRVVQVACAMIDSTFTILDREVKRILNLYKMAAI